MVTQASEISTLIRAVTTSTTRSITGTIMNQRWETMEATAASTMIMEEAAEGTVTMI